MKKLKTRKDFGERTLSIFNTLTQNMTTPHHEEARRFFLQSATTRVTCFYIMSHFFNKKHFTASDVYTDLSPKFGSKSSIVNFISLGFKKGYFLYESCGIDKRKKYLFPDDEFVKIWCGFIASLDGSSIDDSIDWDKVCEKH